jgi:hypothetical protein
MLGMVELFFGNCQRSAKYKDNLELENLVTKLNSHIGILRAIGETESEIKTACRD